MTDIDAWVFVALGIFIAVGVLITVLSLTVKHWVADDPDPEYSRLDRMDGLGREESK